MPAFDGEEKRTELHSWLSMVEQLRQAPDWPADELPIEIKQTHISVLLLGREHVIKLKKPVDFGFLDYTTLAKRRQACEDEVRLNRRLCADIYLGLAVVVEVNGQIHLRNRPNPAITPAIDPLVGPFTGPLSGEIVDYGVLMKRLPDERMLDHLVARDEVTEAMIDRIAGKVSEFHRTAPRGPEVARWGSLAEVRRNWEENFAQTEPFITRTISAPDFEAIRSWIGQKLEREADLFERRVREGRIVDGHGDLRCESICLQDENICIYDCIEFNDRFRCEDVASEVAFLAMDLDARGRPDLGYFFTEACQRRAGDQEFFKLLPFYRSYRAFVRGKVLSFRLDEEEFSAEERRAAAARAAGYFELARRYASSLRRPTVIAVTGLSGTGKTSVARAIAGELGCRVISADAVRQSIFGAAKKPAGYGEGVYTVEANRRTYEEMIQRARQQLGEDGGVVVDATFRHSEERAAGKEMARAAGAEWRLIECRLAEESVRTRLAERAARGEGLSDANWEIYLRQQRESRSFSDERDGDERSGELLALDTSGSRAACSRAASDWLRGRESAAAVNFEV